MQDSLATLALKEPGKVVGDRHPSTGEGRWEDREFKVIAGYLVSLEHMRSFLKVINSKRNSPKPSRLRYR